MAKNKDIPVIYYTNELTDEFSEAKITPIKIDENYNYGNTSWWWRFRHFMYYRILATPIAVIFLQVKYRHKIVNRQIVKPYQNDAFFLFGNHTNPGADALIPTFSSWPKHTYLIVNPENVSVPGLGQSTKFLGAIPLPDNMAATKNFMNTIKLRVEQKSSICIYPEAHIWPYYTGIRPFPDLSFRYPVQYKKPVFCITNTYQKRRFSKNPRLVTYVDGPFFTNEGLSLKEQRADLRNRVYTKMCERASLSNVQLVCYIKKEIHEEISND